MKKEKFLYNIKRFGVKGIAYYIMRQLGIVDDDAVYRSKLSYYTRLKENEYEKELIEWYKALGGKDDLRNPHTFNGKIQWLKLHDYSLKKTILADKFLVREWIKKEIGEKYLIPLIGVYDNFDQIDFSKLPDQFVIKANHGSGMNYVVKNKNQLNIKHLKKMLQKWITTPFGYYGMEIQYLTIPRKILIEKYIQDETDNLFDYKIYCFNGVPKFVEVIGDRNLEKHTGFEAFYDLEWNELPINDGSYPNYVSKMEKPHKLDEMIEISKKLSREFKFVRVDLYLVNNLILFGEMTFTSSNGMDVWNPPELDSKLGEILIL